MAYHARLCDVAASLIRARDACARTLVRLAVDGVVETRSTRSTRGFFFFGDSEASPADEKRLKDILETRREERRRAFFGAADTALHAIATPAWFASVVEEDDEGRETEGERKAFLKRSRLESFLAVFRDERPAGAARRAASLDGARVRGDARYFAGEQRW